jgi:Tol biopolymer transport system component/DNA-binding winged helix-turn-helix (wHTH) protein
MDGHSPRCSRLARFDHFEVDLSARELRKSGQRVPLQEQPFQILRLLLEAAPDLVSREQINSTLWAPGTFVDFDLAVNTAVRKLRQALEDSVDRPKFIQTLAKRGYRFIPAVEWVADASNSPVSGKSHAPPSPAERADKLGRASWLGRYRSRLFVAVGLLIVVSVFGRFYYRPRTLEQPLRAVPLTTLPGQEISPSFSPDGSQVAFGWDGENSGAGFDLYVKVVGTDKPLRLTNHPVPWLGVAWSPDGQNIAVRRTGEDGGLFLVPALGGPERRLTSTHDVVGVEASAISWAPDGTQIAFAAHPPSTSAESTQVFLLLLDTLAITPVETGCELAYDAVFSPDGKSLAYVCTPDAVAFSLKVRELRTHKDTQLLKQTRNISGLAWSRDSSRIIFSCTSSHFSIGGIGGDICQVTPGRNGAFQELPFGHDAASPVISSTRDRLAYAESRINANIWRVDLDGPEPHAHVLAPSTREQYDPFVSFDGKRIAFVSDRSGSQELWVSDSDGGNLRQLTSFGHLSPGTPHWAADGKRIVFDSRVEGEANIYVVEVDGGVPRKVETGTHGNSLPSWSQDGNWIYFASGPADSKLTIWRVPGSGGRATQLTKTLSSMPIESSDGQWVFFVRTVADKVRLWRIRPDGSDEQMLDAVPPLATNGYEWWPAATGMYFYAYRNGKAEVDFFDFGTSRTRRIYSLDKSPANWMGGLSVSPDGKWLVYSRVDEVTSDLMLVEGFH